MSISIIVINVKNKFAVDVYLSVSETNSNITSVFFFNNQPTLQCDTTEPWS